MAKGPCMLTISLVICNHYSTKDKVTYDGKTRRGKFYPFKNIGQGHTFAISQNDKTLIVYDSHSNDHYYNGYYYEGSDEWDNWRLVITELAQGKQLLFFPGLSDEKNYGKIPTVIERDSYIDGVGLKHYKNYCDIGVGDTGSCKDYIDQLDLDGYITLPENVDKVINKINEDRKKKLELYDATSDMNDSIEGETSSSQMMTARTSPQMMTARTSPQMMTRSMRSMEKKTE
jgi:hypothetical protein